MTSANIRVLGTIRILRLIRLTCRTGTYQICNNTIPQKQKLLKLDGRTHTISFKNSIVSPGESRYPIQLIISSVSIVERYYFVIVAWSFPTVKNLSILLTYNFTSDATGNELSSEDQYEPYAQASRVIAYAASALGVLRCLAYYVTDFQFGF